MANQRYDQKPAGTVTPEKILLLADPVTGALEKVTVEQILGYKVYTALITSTGTGDPTVTILGDNTIGTIVWTRVGVGEYEGTLIGAFPNLKTWCTSGREFSVPIYLTNLRRGVSSDVVVMTCLNDGFSSNDLDGANIPIEIRVYP